MTNLQKLASAFQALTYREMMDCADLFSEALDAQNGLKVKPAVFAEMLDGFGEFLEVEVRTEA